MRIKKPVLSVVFKLLLLAAVIAGLYQNMFHYLEGFSSLSLRYFTIQSNILVALALIYFLLSSENNRGRTIVRGSVLLSITITGLVFHILLKPHLGDLFPGGIDLANHLTHTAAPLGFMLDWLLFDHKGRMQPADLPYWTIYPLLYWLVTVLLGARTGFYPYFFMDVGELGYGGALLWLAALVVVFLLVGIIIMGVDRLLGRRAGPGSSLCG